MAQLHSPFSFSFGTGADVGWGIDIVTGDLRRFAVTGISPAGTRLDSVTTHTRSVSTASDYTSLINSVTTVQGSTLVDSFSTGVAYLRQTSMGATTFSLVIGATVQAMEYSLANPSAITLSDEAAQYLAAEGPQKFMELYGTHFIGGYITGGDFLGSVNIRTSSATTQQQIAASMHVALSSGFSGGTFDSSFKTAYSQFASESSLDSTVESNGGPVSLPSDPDAIAAESKSFVTDLTTVPNEGRRMVALGYTWDNIPAVPALLAQHGYAPDSMSITMSSEVLSILRGELSALSYLEQTAQALQGVTLPLPHQAVLLNSAIDQIASAQSAIRALTLAELGAMTVPQAQIYVASPPLSAIITPITQQKVAVQWTASLDNGFVNVPTPLAGTALLKISGDTLNVGAFLHSREGGDSRQQAILSLVLSNDNGNVSLQSIFTWQDPYGPGGGTFDGAAINLNDPTASTAPSQATWTKFNANWVKAQLL